MSESAADSGQSQGRGADPPPEVLIAALQDGTVMAEELAPRQLDELAGLLGPTGFADALGSADGDLPVPPFVKGSARSGAGVSSATANRVWWGRPAVWGGLAAGLLLMAVAVPVLRSMTGSSPGATAPGGTSGGGVVGPGGMAADPGGFTGAFGQTRSIDGKQVGIDALTVGTLVTRTSAGYHPAGPRDAGIIAGLVGEVALGIDGRPDLVTLVVAGRAPARVRGTGTAISPGASLTMADGGVLEPAKDGDFVVAYAAAGHPGEGIRVMPVVLIDLSG